MGDMWTRTQIDEWTASIHRGAAAIWYLILDEMYFVRTIFEHLQQGVFIQI